MNSTHARYMLAKMLSGEKNVTGVSLDFSDREKFCDIFQDFFLEVLVQFWISPLCSIHLNFSPSSKQGKVCQVRETFPPKSPL